VELPLDGDFASLPFGRFAFFEHVWKLIRRLPIPITTGRGKSLGFF